MKLSSWISPKNYQTNNVIKSQYDVLTALQLPPPHHIPSITTITTNTTTFNTSYEFSITFFLSFSHSSHITLAIQPRSPTLATLAYLLWMMFSHKENKGNTFKRWRKTKKNQRFLTIQLFKLKHQTIFWIM